MDLTTASIIEKNKTASNGVYLLLMDLIYKGESIHLVYNNEDFEFNGVTYTAYDFKVSSLKTNESELPDSTLTVSNITGTIQRIIEEYGGINGAEVVLRVVNTNVKTVADEEEHFVVTGVSANNTDVSIKLGMSISTTKRFPPIRILKDSCQFKYKGRKCGYKGDIEKCNKTLADCRKHNNSKRYGGCATVPQGGLYVRGN